MAQTEDRVEVEGLFEAHYADVLAYCARRVGRNEAEDVAGEVFAVAWRRRSEIESATARPWLYGVARGVISNRWRSGRRQHRLVDRLTGTVPLPVDGPDTVVVRREQDRAVMDTLRKLKQTDSEILMLAGWEGLSAPEIAVALGISVSAAEQRLHRAKRRFAQALAAQGGEIE
ncbi:MAG: sigma-70 family RNA polymerase sigma factor [Acidimicrobiia bacterium]|nr:sigma-70 family RNA polymerase sigma factor [Acidimicrobiia bacterium]